MNGCSREKAYLFAQLLLLKNILTWKKISYMFFFLIKGILPAFIYNYKAFVSWYSETQVFERLFPFCGHYKRKQKKTEYIEIVSLYSKRIYLILPLIT